MSKPQRVGFFLIPGFAMTSFSLSIEALTATNRVAGEGLYDYLACYLALPVLEIRSRAPAACMFKRLIAWTRAWNAMC